MTVIDMFFYLLISCAGLYLLEKMLCEHIFRRYRQFGFRLKIYQMLDVVTDFPVQKFAVSQKTLFLGNLISYKGNHSGQEYDLSIKINPTLTLWAYTRGRKLQIVKIRFNGGLFKRSLNITQNLIPEDENGLRELSDYLLKVWIIRVGNNLSSSVPR